MTGRNPQAGVTLLETLIGLLVMAMVAALLSAGLGNSTRALTRSAAASDLVEQALARRDLRLWLEHVLTAQVPGDARPLLTGTNTHLTFLTVPPAGMFWPGTATEVSLGFEGVTVRATGTGAGGRSEQSVTLLLAGSGTNISFRYWGRRGTEDQPGWHDDWPAGQGIPDLVRISFAGETRSPPPLIVRPAKAWAQSEMSLSSLVPPALPSRP